MDKKLLRTHAKAFIGEGHSVNTSNPEVVAPLEKLKKLINDIKRDSAEMDEMYRALNN